MISDEDWATICIDEKENLFTELAGRVIPKQKEKTKIHLVF